MEYYQVGKIVNTHGIRGELKVLPITDFPEQRFKKGSKLYIEQDHQDPIEVTVKNARDQKTFLLVTLVGYEDINKVEQFKNHELLVSEADQQALDDGRYYYHDIIGLDVQTADGESIGKIKEILSPGANDVWVVKRAGQDDLLLPVIDDVIKNVDLESHLVVVELMEGM